MHLSRSLHRGVARPQVDASAGITLFERLSAPEGGAACGSASSPAALRTSVIDEVMRLFTTRRPQRDGLAVGLPLTLLDYGLPDLTSFSMRQDRTRRKLVLEMTQALDWFEPRLLDPEVALSEAHRAGSPARVRIVAGIAIDDEIHPFDFEMDL